jgi:hypothetical protein
VVHRPIAAKKAESAEKYKTAQGKARSTAIIMTDYLSDEHIVDRPPSPSYVESFEDLRLDPITREPQNEPGPSGFPTHFLIIRIFGT